MINASNRNKNDENNENLLSSINDCMYYKNSITSIINNIIKKFEMVNITNRNININNNENNKIQFNKHNIFKGPLKKYNEDIILIYIIDRKVIDKKGFTFYFNDVINIYDELNVNQIIKKNVFRFFRI